MPNLVDDGVQDPDLGLALRPPGVEEPPDHARAHERDRHGQEDDRLGQRLPLDAVDEAGDDQAEQHAPGGAEDQPEDVVAEGDPHGGVREREAVVVDEAAVLRDAHRDGADRREDEVQAEQCQGGTDEDPRQQPLAPAVAELLDDVGGRSEQGPGPDRADEERDQHDEPPPGARREPVLAQGLGAGARTEQVVEAGQHALGRGRVGDEDQGEPHGDHHGQGHDHRPCRAQRLTAPPARAVDREQRSDRHLLASSRSCRAAADVGRGGAATDRRRAVTRSSA
jgi:hypothetical protein